MKLFKQKFVASCAVLISFFIFGYFIFDGITLPYVGPNATNFTVYSLIAHNFNTFGFFDTKFAPIISVSPTLPENPEYFFHHPTLLSTVEAILFRIFGEDFWVGRLTVILFSFGSLILTYFIGKNLVNKAYGVVAMVVMTIIPASTLFGKMIGQEPLVLFFCLLSLYAILKYFYTEKKIYLFVVAFAIVLGILSDWPMAFFSLCFIPLFIKHKKRKLGIYFVVLSIITTLLLLLYVYVMRSGFWDLQNALALRSVNGLLDISFWPIRWIGATLFRMAVYFNPLIFLFAIISLIGIYKKYRKEHLADSDMVILGLLFFCALHLLIYAQASFTHPYLIYYTLAFVTFGSSIIVYKLFTRKAYRYLFTIACFSIVYLFIIQAYKSAQITANLWRYDLAKAVSNYLTPYEEVVINSGSAIDSDLLWYPFLFNWQVADPNTSVEYRNHNHFVYSCPGVCMSHDIQFAALKRQYRHIQIKHQNAEAYIFLLDQRSNLKIRGQNQGEKIYLRNSSTSSLQDNQIRTIYRNLRDLLHVPQF